MPSRQPRPPRRRRWAALAVAASVVGAVACTGDGDDAAPSTSSPVTTTTAPSRPDDGTLSLGVFLPTTGPGATLGNPMIDAVEAAVENINARSGVFGRPVEVTIVDESADTGFDALLAADVDAIVGPASSVVALSQLDATVQPGTGVVTCSPSATALALDDYPDNGFFFRTVPSDSLQMVAITRRAERTGVRSVAVGYLDDPYGRGLASSLVSEIETRRRLTVTAEVGFGGDEEDLSERAAALLDGDPGVVIVLGDADDGSRLLAALDQATDGTVPPQIIVNDAIRGARQTIRNLSPEFRQRLTGVAPLARSVSAEGPEGFFAAHAYDCVNLIALAAIQAGTDSPSRIQANIASVSVGGSVCSSFADCAERLSQGLQIDYNGASGSVELSTTTGDPVRAWFEAFGFDATGADDRGTTQQFEVP